MSAIGRLLSAIGYPQVPPADAVEFTLQVDGRDVFAYDMDTRLVLVREISRGTCMIQKLAAYSTGRMLREDAILFWDERRGAAMLSQEIPATATSHELKEFFETFADSCDWWAQCTAEVPGRQPPFTETVIRP